MEQKNLNGVNGLANHKFKYNDDSYGLWNTWDELISYWAIFYNNSKAAADSHFRKYAYGCICDKNGYEIAYSKKKRTPYRKRTGRTYGRDCQGV